MSYNKLFITITMLMLIFAACRKEWIATEEDMTNYGWTLFEQANLDLSSNTAEEDFDYVLKWFEDATKTCVAGDWHPCPSWTSRVFRHPFFGVRARACVCCACAKRI